MNREELLKRINDLLDEYDGKPKIEIQSEDELWPVGTRVSHLNYGNGVITRIDKNDFRCPYFIDYGGWTGWGHIENLTKIENEHN